jgi:type II secretory pathway pseudopilin PulG
MTVIRQKVAFTLAEVLLTLTIIGLIAAMTIPGLINSTNKTENVVALKKAYSTLSQSFLMITADNGGDITSALSNVVTHDDFANVFIPKLNVAKNCGTSNPTGGCFPNALYKYLNGGDWGGTNFSTNGWSTILTNDGMSYAFAISSTNCTFPGSVDTTSPLHNVCGSVFIDINGSKKGPSVMGRDLFYFWLTKKGIYPAGAYPDVNNNDCLPTGGGGCAGKVLVDGAMNY